MARNVSGGGSGRPRRSRYNATPSSTSTIDSSRSSRTAWLLVFFGALAVIFFFRLFFLQVIVAGDYSAQAQDARTISIEVSARRGTIYDRNGNVLATSVDASTIYANPYEIENPVDTSKQLAAILGGKDTDYLEKLTQSNTSFSYIERKADMDKADQLKNLDLKGIYFISDTKRVYPYNEVGGQVIGLIGVDGEGLTGLEMYYDDILSGTPGTLTIENGALGMPIPGGVKEQTTAVDGQDIIISLDIGLQQYVEERVKKGAEDIGGTSGNATVMDAETGEIYACSSTPLFNPNDTNSITEGSTQLKGITNGFEPGSIFKTVSALAILEADAMKPTDEMFVPAILSADEYQISDAHERGDQTMTFGEILDQSSNVGISLATQKVGFENYYNKIKQYRLAEPTGVDYPGEATGWLAPYQDWSLVQAYNVTFGQGIAVTPIQMANFYAALRNNGTQYTPHFLIEKPLTDEVVEYEEKKIIDDSGAIAELNTMLQSVVDSGTGELAQIEGYKVAGKTSTAEIYDESGGYRDGVYTICFTGFLSDSSSQLVCFVGVEEVPGDRVVTPVFKDIMSFAIERYKITSN